MSEADRKAAYRWCAATLRNQPTALRDSGVLDECERIVVALETAGAMPLASVELVEITDLFEPLSNGKGRS